jgi:hypothetical protein
MTCLNCALSDLLEATQPPDPELADLIDWAFLDGQIDGQAADLAYLLIVKKAQICARDIN